MPRERCTVCHNREDDLKRIEDVTFMHQTHVTDHKVDCMSCHLELHHSLDANKIANAVSDCAKCHPNHHEQQVAMLEGTGAKLVPEYQSNMVAARLSCFTCHQRKEVSATGSVLMKASLQTCVGCHAPEEIDGLQTYHEQLRELLGQLDSEVERIEEALTAATLEPPQRVALVQRLDDLQHDLRFLHIGNDIHNSHYASELIGKLLEELTALCRDLQLDPPEITLPEKPARVPTHSPLRRATNGSPPNRMPPNCAANRMRTPCPEPEPNADVGGQRGLGANAVRTRPHLRIRLPDTSGKE